MGLILFIIRSSFEDFRRNKIRTFLASLGILIGVSSVVLLMSFGLGLKRYIQQQFESLGSNMIMILPGAMVQGGSIRMSPGMMTFTRFDKEDARKLAKLDFVTDVVPADETAKEMTAHGKTEWAQTVLGDENVFKGLNLAVEFGEYFDKADVERRSKKVVLGPKIAQKLFGDGKSAVGEDVKIGDQNFHIAGVLVSKGGGSLGEPGIDEHVYIPYTSATGISGAEGFVAIYLKISDNSRTDEVIADINRTMLKKYDKEEFSIMKQTQMLESIGSIIGTLNLVLIAVACISLVVGGVGIMNIMYVSVAERIFEIGLRRSVGATKMDIILLFISEGILLSLLGGLMGLSLAYGVVKLIQSYFPAYIDGLTVSLSLGVSTIIGVVFGIIPARKASLLSPIEAIRHE